MLRIPILRVYRWTCELLYRDLAWTYDLVSWIVSLGHWAKWQAVALRYVQGEHVLEIGFGTGKLLLQLSELNPSVVGIDRSPHMISIASRRARKRFRSPGLSQAAAQHLPFRDGEFDTVVLTFPAEYIVEANTLKELARVVRCEPKSPNDFGGKIVIVGLWVSIDHWFLAKVLPVFYSPIDETIKEAIRQPLEAADMTVSFHEHVDGLARVGIVTAHTNVA